jgi:hypothetical protein
MTRVPPVLLALAAWLMTAAPVAGDCEPAGPPAAALRAAEIAFVGTVVDVAGSTATLEVREVWAGDDVPARVEVHGLASDGRGDDVPVFSEDDRVWVRGETYLVLPFPDGGVLRDHICTATSEWTDDLAALRPSDARIPAEPAVAPGIPGSLIVVVATALGLGVVSYLAFARRGGA